MAYLVSSYNDAVFTDADTAKKAANIESISRFGYICPREVSIDPPLKIPVGFVVRGDVDVICDKAEFDYRCAKPIYSECEMKNDYFRREFNFHCYFRIYIPFHGEDHEEYRVIIRTQIHERFNAWWQENKERFDKECMDEQLACLMSNFIKKHN